MASLNRIMLSSCLTVILKLLLAPCPLASSLLKILYFSTSTSHASGVNRGANVRAYLM